MSVIGAGIPIGVNDRHGRPIHIGDTLQFDPVEWGGPDKPFTIILADGAIQHPGSTADLTNWCEKVDCWDSFQDNDHIPFQFVVPDKDTLDEYRGVGFDAIEVCFNDCEGFHEFLSGVSETLNPGERYGMIIYPVVSGLPKPFMEIGPDSRLYENVCPDCGGTNGGGIVSEKTPLDETDPYSPCMNPCMHCDKGPMEVRFITRENT